MIRTSYDQEADVMHVTFAADDAGYDASQEVAPGVYLEFDTQGRVIGVEITSVSKHPVSAAPARFAAA